MPNALPIEECHGMTNENSQCNALGWIHVFFYFENLGSLVILTLVRAGLVSFCWVSSLWWLRRPPPVSVCTLCLNGIDSVYLVDNQGLGYELKYGLVQKTRNKNSNKQQRWICVCVCRLCLIGIDQDQGPCQTWIKVRSLLERINKATAQKTKQ